MFVVIQSEPESAATHIIAIIGPFDSIRAAHEYVKNVTDDIYADDFEVQPLTPPEPANVR